MELIKTPIYRTVQLSFFRSERQIGVLMYSVDYEHYIEAVSTLT